MKFADDNLIQRVLTHLVKQGKPAKDLESSRCYYRTSEGLKCAVGCLIKDEFYTENLEGKDIKKVSVQNAVNRSLGTLLNDLDLAALSLLQSVHDGRIKFTKDMFNHLLVFPHTFPEEPVYSFSEDTKILESYYNVKN